MLRWLFIAFMIYLIYRLISGTRRIRRSGPTFTFRVGRYPGNGYYTRAGPGQRGPGGRGPGGRRPSRKKPLDQIEEAEFEDITDLERPEKKPEKKSEP